MATFNNGESLSSVRTKINDAIDKIDGNATISNNITVGGNIAVTGTVDGRDVAADGTKLDGIEALADVTDTANVTAAGALMDSELTSEASVKALDQGVATTDSPTFAGLTTTADVTFGDNDKATFGAGSDLQIYHDGADSYVHDAGVGNLHLRGGNQVLLQNATGTLNYVVGNATGEWVKLYHGSLERLETTSTGVHITGNTTFDNGGKAIFGTNNDLTIFSDGTHSRIEDSATNSGDLYIRGSNNLRLQTWDGVSAWQDAIVMDDAGAAELYHDGALKLTTTSTGIAVTGSVDFGDWTITESGGSLYFATGGTNKMKLDASGNLDVVGSVNTNATIT